MCCQLDALWCNLNQNTNIFIQENTFESVVFKVETTNLGLNMLKWSVSIPPNHWLIFRKVGELNYNILVYQYTWHMQLMSDIVVLANFAIMLHTVKYSVILLTTRPVMQKEH